MIKRFLKKKVIISTAVLFAFFLISLVPNNQIYTLESIPEKLSYVSKDIKTNTIYLLDKNNLLAKTSIITNSTNNVALARELINTLIIDGINSDKLPSGFKAVLPSETKILTIEEDKDNKLLKVNLSKEVFENINNDEIIIESLIYTLTSIENIHGIILYIDGSVLSKLPITGKILPSLLTRSYGINKEYNFDNYNNVDKYTIYYVGKYNDDYYYVPVTKYVNSDSKDKIKVIIDELVSGPSYTSNLMNFLNSNTKLLTTIEDVDTLFLVFNEYIFSDCTEENILEEVIYTIALSIKENTDIKNVVFEVGDKEIYKSVLKTIE